MHIDLVKSWVLKKRKCGRKVGDNISNVFNQRTWDQCPFDRGFVNHDDDEDDGNDDDDDEDDGDDYDDDDDDDDEDDEDDEDDDDNDDNDYSGREQHACANSSDISLASAKGCFFASHDLQSEQLGGS